jgi:ribosomal protein L29
LNFTTAPIRREQFGSALLTTHFRHHGELENLASDASRMLIGIQSSSAKVKTGQLWGKGKDDLKKQLEELKTELGQLRVQKIAGGASSKLTRMCVTTILFFPNSQPSLL